MADSGSDKTTAGAPTVDERRRLVEMTLDRRPEMDLDQLQDILARLGIDVDTETLVDDLDVLGFEVDDPPEVESPAPGVGDLGGSALPATLVDGIQDDGPDLDDDELAAAVRAESSRPVDRYAPLMVVAAAVLVIVVAAVVILGTGDDDDGQATAVGGDGSAESVQATSEGAGAGTGGPPPVAPPGPGTDPALTEPDLTFDFAADSAVLPVPADGTRWEPITGDFEIAGGQALSTVPGEEGVLVGLTGPTPDARIQVTLPVPSEGAGLAFAIDDDGSDYYAWVAVPAFSTINLYRVTDGQREVVANSGVTPVEPGVTLGLNIVGTTAELLANGTVVSEVDDIVPTPRWGLVALSATTPGVFDDLLVQYP